MSDNKPTVIYSTARLIELQAQVNAILSRERSGQAQLVPCTQQLVAMAELADRALQNIKEGFPVNDHLLDTIGALHTRNKSLQKGHATLTRRVQELETELLAEKKQTEGRERYIESLLNTSRLSDRAVDAIIADVMKPEPTAADRQLQDDIASFYALVNRFEKKWGLK